MMHRVQTEELVIKNRDGKRMPATLILPEGTPKGTVLILHGVAGWKDQPLHKLLATSFAELGYVVFRFSESDSPASPDSDFFHETTTQYTRDLEDAMEYVQSKEWFAKPLLLVGHSMGGLLACWYAATRKNEVSRLVLLAPAVSWKMMWWTQLPLALLWMIRGHQMQLGVDGKEFALSPLWWKDFGTFDGYAYAKHIEVPTLVISAEKDYAVAKPFEHRWFTKRFKNGEHSTITWADHDFDGHEAEVVATINQWLTSS